MAAIHQAKLGTINRSTVADSERNERTGEDWNIKAVGRPRGVRKSGVEDSNNGVVGFPLAGTVRRMPNRSLQDDAETNSEGLQHLQTKTELVQTLRRRATNRFHK